VNDGLVLLDRFLEIAGHVHRQSSQAGMPLDRTTAYSRSSRAPMPWSVFHQATASVRIPNFTIPYSRIVPDRQGRDQELASWAIRLSAEANPDNEIEKLISWPESLAATLAADGLWIHEALSSRPLPKALKDRLSSELVRMATAGEVSGRTGSARRARDFR